MLLLLNTTLADTRDQAKRMHDRLAGVPPTATVLDNMQDSIDGGNAVAAALIAMDNPNFYKVTLKNWATPWTNRDQTVFAPLNDYSATVIGMIKNDVPFNLLLSENIVYHANGVSKNGQSAPNYSAANNDHYEWLEDNDIDLAAELTRDQQQGIAAGATAGVMTTRAAAAAFFVAGTNRAMFRFTLLNHMCNDLEQVKDTTRSADRIRQDVSRSPGGDSRLFLNNCVACHAGMDPMAQAFAYYNYDEAAGRIEYTEDTVQPKYFINGETFSPGYVTPDNQWENYWREGQNASLDWDSGRPGSGTGAKTMGEELANSRAFAACQVKKAFNMVCLRDPANAGDHSKIETMTNNFQANYQMKPVFAEAAAYCMGPAN
ncbi:MAG: hypothetical protein GQ538_02220 [Xanthomonadales bacterium]|nr:hypothetical protein [Xanthomonadales bacterium]